jgi:hypothetical protein
MMADAPSSGFSLGGLTLDAGSLFGPATTNATTAPSTTSPQLTPETQNAITQGIVNIATAGLNAGLSLFGVKTPAQAAAEEEARRKAAQAQTTMLVIAGIAVVALGAVAFVLVKK